MCQIVNDLQEICEHHPRIRKHDFVEYPEKYYLRIRSNLLARHPNIQERSVDIVALMAYLGPPGQNSPPPSLVQELESLAETYCCNCESERELSIIIQIAIAYACKWKRLQTSGQSQWDTYWPQGIQEIRELTRQRLRQALADLTELVPGFREKLRNDQQVLDANDLEGMAYIITAYFIGLRELSSAESSQKDEENGPIQKYRAHQQLASWSPSEGNLYTWLSGAIMGQKDTVVTFDEAPKRAQKSHSTLRTNFFRNGLLFPFLKSERLLEIGELAFQWCWKCQPDLQNDEQRKKEYESPFCDHCHSDHLVVHETRLCVPGVYVGKEFWAVRSFTQESSRQSGEKSVQRVNKRTLHYIQSHMVMKQKDMNGAVCPHCHTAPSQRPTTLLVRSPGGFIESSEEAEETDDRTPEKWLLMQERYQQ